MQTGTAKWMPGMQSHLEGRRTMLEHNTARKCRQPLIRQPPHTPGLQQRLESDKTMMEDKKMTSGKTGIGHKLPLVTYEFGQTIKTARYPDGVNVHLYDGGTSLDIGQLVSENTLDVMASAGFNLKHAQRASYTELDIDQSSPVTLPNGQASSLAELAEIVYQAFTKVAQKKKFLPTLRRNTRLDDRPCRGDCGGCRQPCHSSCIHHRSGCRYT